MGGLCGRNGWLVQRCISASHALPPPRSALQHSQRKLRIWACTGLDLAIFSFAPAVCRRCYRFARRYTLCRPSNLSWCLIPFTYFEFFIIKKRPRHCSRLILPIGALKRGFTHPERGVRSGTFPLERCSILTRYCFSKMIASTTSISYLMKLLREIALNLDSAMSSKSGSCDLQMAEKNYIRIAPINAHHSHDWLRLEFKRFKYSSDNADKEPFLFGAIIPLVGDLARLSCVYVRRGPPWIPRGSTLWQVRLHLMMVDQSLDWWFHQHSSLASPAEGHVRFYFL